MRLLDVDPAVRRYPRRAVLVAAATAAVALLLALFAITRQGGDPVFEASDGLRVWTGGDSLSYYVGTALNDGLAADGATPVREDPDTHRSSGLLSPEFFDWTARARDEMAAYDPDVAVFMIGTNDAASGIDEETYRARVGATMDAFAGRTLIWIGVPNMSDPVLAANAIAVNEAFRAEAARRPWVRFIDTWNLTSEAGRYVAAAEIDGVMATLRADDGIHLTPEGGRLIARAVLESEGS
jgi:hypothetical protein